ncbi:hypothetical protein MFUL124B02_23180 [Myxococcus fulvus 124B02]|nr:hypothetical protein MFUL124B02_23180 [Myxococcus fulvus 124B02]
MNDAYSIVCPIEPTDPRRILDLDSVAFQKFRGYGLVPDESLSALEQARPLALVALAMPDGIEDRVRAVADLWMWDYVFDEHFVDGGLMQGNPAAACNLILPLLHLFECPEYAQPAPGSWEAALQDICKKMESLCGPGELTHWASVTRDMFVAFAFGVSFGQAGARPGFRDTLRLRMDTTGSKSFLSLGPYMNGFALSDRELAIPEVKAANQACSVLLALDNDLLSYDREKALEKGVMVNTVEALATQEGISANEAAERIIIARNQTMALYLRLRHTLEQKASREVVRYLDTMGSWVRAALDWSLATLRYRSFTDQASFGSRLHLVDTASEPLDLGQGGSIWWWDLPGVKSLNPQPTPSASRAPAPAGERFQLRH